MSETWGLDHQDWRAAQDWISAQRNLAASRDYLSVAWRLRKCGEMGPYLYAECRAQTLAAIRHYRREIARLRAQQHTPPRMEWRPGCGDFVERYAAHAFAGDEE